MRHLVRLSGEDVLALGLRRNRGIVENCVLEGEDRAPVLHRGEELRLSGTRDVIQFGERVWRAEIIVEIGQDLRLGIERIVRLRSISS